MKKNGLGKQKTFTNCICDVTKQYKQIYNIQCMHLIFLFIQIDIVFSSNDLNYIQIYMYIIHIYLNIV